MSHPFQAGVAKTIHLSGKAVTSATGRKRRFIASTKTPLKRGVDLGQIESVFGGLHSLLLISHEPEAILLRFWLHAFLFAHLFRHAGAPDRPDAKMGPYQAL